MTDSFFFWTEFQGNTKCLSGKKAFRRIFNTVPDRRRMKKNIQFPQNPNIIKKGDFGSPPMRSRGVKYGNARGGGPFREGNIGLFPFGSKCLWQLTGGSDQP